MKENKLEKFVGMEKEAFEKDFNEELVWQKIESRIIKKESKKSFNWYAAASIVFIFTIAWLLVDRAYLTDKMTALEQVTVEGQSYQQIETYYAQTISQKTLELEQQSKAIDYPLNEDINSLQENYQQLKLQLKQQGVNEKVINAMILNLRTQIALLNEQLSIIESINQYVKKEKENDTQI